MLREAAPHHILPVAKGDMVKDDTGDLCCCENLYNQKTLPLDTKSPALAVLFEEPCSERLNESLQSQTEHLQRD